MMAEIKQCGTHSKFQVKNKKKKMGGEGNSPFLFRFPQIKLRKKVTERLSLDLLWSLLQKFILYRHDFI